MSDKVREAFEAWARAEVLPDDCSHIEWDGCEAWCYCLATSSRIELTDEWTVWQASRRAALEEAAKACDDEAAEWEAQVDAAGKLSSITKHAVESTAVGARRSARRVRTLAQGGAA